MEQQTLDPEFEAIETPAPASEAPNDGNGRPRGARNRKHRALERVARSEAIPLLQTVINAAKNGDMMAAKIILDRVWPKPRTAPITLDLPATSTPADIRSAMHELLARVAQGELTTDDGAALIGMMKDMLAAHVIDARILPETAAVQTVDVRQTFADRLARVIEARRQTEAAPDA
jgi:hypothetical protein